MSGARRQLGWWWGAVALAVMHGCAITEVVGENDLRADVVAPPVDVAMLPMDAGPPPMDVLEEPEAATTVEVGPGPRAETAQAQIDVGVTEAATSEKGVDAAMADDAGAARGCTTDRECLGERTPSRCDLGTNRCVAR